MGGRGTYIQLHGTEGKWGAYVVEVPGAGALNPEKHMYEEIYLVVEGRGSTEVWLEGDNKRHIFEWQKGSLFSIPVNAMHRIVNAELGAGAAPWRHHRAQSDESHQQPDAIFNCPYQFRDRFSGADDFYKYKDDIEPDPVRGLAMRRTNFIPDIVNCDLPLDNRRSPGWRRVEPFMTGNTFLSVDRPARERPLFQGARAHLGRRADLRQGQGLHLYLAGAARPDAVEGRQGATRSSASTTSRSAWCRRRPAARAGITSISAHRRSRSASPPGSARTIPAASPARPARSTSTTRRWIFPKAAPRSPITWRIRSCARNTPNA